MNIAYIYFALAAFTVFTVVMIAIIRDFPYKRMVLVGLFFITLATQYVAVSGSLSLPRPYRDPINLFMSPPITATILGSYSVESKYIMLLLMWDGLEYPQYFVFPWSKNMGEQLQHAKNSRKSSEAGDGDGEIQIDNPFDLSLEDRADTFVHLKPQPSAGPDKQAPEAETFAPPPADVRTFLSH